MLKSDIPKIVILGAGFAGLTLATELDTLAASGKAEVTVIEKNQHFSMGFSMQWALAGRRKPEEGQRQYSGLRAKNVRFINGEAAKIDTSAKIVYTASDSIEFDYLVIALGAELAPELIQGLQEAAYNLCDPDSVTKLKNAIEKAGGGTIVVAVAGVPFKCPAAPYEYALLIDDMLRKRGVREHFRIMVTTPEPQPMPVAGKEAGDAIKAMLADRKIEFLPEHKIVAVDVNVIAYENGAQMRFDILAAMPPHRAPRTVRESGLADASGFVPAELGTFKTAIENTYAVGDVASIKLPDGKPHPKAGIFAETQAMAVARRIAAEITGSGETWQYTGKGACYVDTGREEAAPAEADLLATDKPKVVLSPPSAKGLEGKKEFERERLEKWFD